LKSPAVSEQVESQTKSVQKFFGGMLKGGTPLSVIDNTHVYRHINCIGKGPYAAGRTGTRRYSRTVLPVTDFTANAVNDRLTIDNRLETADRVIVHSDGQLPAPLAEQTFYYVIFIDTDTIQLALTIDDALAGTAIDITDAGVGTHYLRYAGIIRASLDHNKELCIVKQYGRRVYVSNKMIEEYIEVLNLEIYDPVDIDCRLVESGSNAILAASYIYRIVLNADFYYMYRLNCPVPTTLITDVNETGVLVYGYRYVSGYGRIEGTNIRNRLTNGASLVLETGTVIDPVQEKYFGEVFFQHAIGADLTQNHVIYYLQVPVNCQSINFHTLYRTKNIGITTGGAGNNKAFFVWADDVPVAKPMSITVAANVATIVAGQAGWVYGDVGCTLRVDAAGTRSAVIASYISANQVNLVGGHTLGAVENVAIGAGRVMTASQTGHMITKIAGDDFVLNDEGRTFYWGDGGEIIIRRYIDVNNVESATSETHAAQAGTIQLNAGDYGFRRKWNDTILDDGVAVGEIGLVERILSQRDFYIPQINYRPVPSSNIVVTGTGFTIFADRDDSDYWYSNIGYKPYIEGQYRADHQFGSLKTAIRTIEYMPSLAIIISADKVYILALNVPIPNVGNADVGEYIQKLTEATEAESAIGVIHYKTIAYISSSLFIAVTNEPSVRKFNGHSWSPENFAVSANGLPAVMDDLNKIDSSFDVIGWYSQMDGYKIYAYKWQVV